MDSVVQINSDTRDYNSHAELNKKYSIEALGLRNEHSRLYSYNSQRTKNVLFKCGKQHSSSNRRPNGMDQQMCMMVRFLL